MFLDYNSLVRAACAAAVILAVIPVQARADNTACAHYFYQGDYAEAAIVCAQYADKFAQIAEDSSTASTKRQMLRAAAIAEIRAAISAHQLGDSEAYTSYLDDAKLFIKGARQYGMTDSLDDLIVAAQHPQ